MNTPLAKLLAGAGLSFALGLALCPVLLQRDAADAQSAVADAGQSTQQEGTATDRTGGQQGVAVDESSWDENEDSDTEADNDAWISDETQSLLASEDDSGSATVPGGTDTPTAALEPAEADVFLEDDVPVDPQQDNVPKLRPAAQMTAAMSQVRQLQTVFEKTEKQEYVANDLKPADWKQADALYKTLAERMDAKLGAADEQTVLSLMAAPENRLDLARLTMLRRAGAQAVQQAASTFLGAEMMAKLGNDLNWLDGLLHSGPTENLGTALDYLAAIYAADDFRLKEPVTRRIATATALEFAREGWSKEDMLARFKFYNTAWHADKLNAIFDELAYWDTRLVTGCSEPGQKVGQWGDPRNLAWLCDNVRLPVERYLGCESHICYRLRNVAGDSVFSSEYLAPILKYTDNITAWAYREIGGVCGALSHYAAFSALAAGIPAMTMGEPGHCAYAIRIGDEWKLGNSIYWQHSLQKKFWGEPGWDFLILMQDLYQDRYPTLVSDELTAMADYLTARKKKASAFRTYDVALAAQPLNWNAITRYRGYLKSQDPGNVARWSGLHKHVADGLGAEHYHAAATMLCRYVYPDLLPLQKDPESLTDLFAGLCSQFKDWGSNRWDVTPLLEAQTAAFKDDDARKKYVSKVLGILMKKKDYAGAVLTWGLNYIAKLDGDEGAKEDYTDMLLKSMQRTSRSKKELDDTWATLGEAIYAAAENDEVHVFQAIGKLASHKCRAKFPRHRAKLRGFPGRVVSMNGSIRTATTIDPGQMKECCLHWAVLQRTGGKMPGKFEGDAGLTCTLEGPSTINGIVCVCEKPIEKEKKDRPFYIEISNDGQNWQRTAENGVIEGTNIRFDMRHEKPTAKYVRMLREGDKYEPTISGFYVFGKKNRA
ncbi:MAG: hypothetical protein Q4E43_08595 [Akkermansia sp.]|nr:hypothetical protein [Akkermansia sp.]